MSTFVTVGNAHQPFQRLLDAVAAVVNQLPQPVIVQYGHGQFTAPGCDARAFVTMAEFERLIEAADLVVQHAGGGGVLYAIRAGKVPVIMPRRALLGEHIDDHQVENAEALARTGKAVVVHEAEKLLAGVRQALALQRHSRPATGTSEMVRLISAVLDRYARQISA
ncbi:MAG TPA: glycosyltransferase [Nevskiales bacterium]|nr:glycosyltransferase [Nevskiales bacterium]